MMMNRDAVESKVKRIVACQLNQDVSSIDSNANLKEDLFADSLDIYNIRIEIEKSFDFAFSQLELENLLRINEIVDVVCKKL